MAIWNIMKFPVDLRLRFPGSCCKLLGMKLKGDNEQIIITAITERIAPAGEWQYITSNFKGVYLIPIRTIQFTYQDIFQVVFLQ